MNMNEKSAQPVDVLAVMLDLIVEVDADENEALYIAGTAARAAVAELIAAADALPRCSYCDADEEWDRLIAALARVQGGAA